MIVSRRILVIVNWKKRQLVCVKLMTAHFTCLSPNPFKEKEQHETNVKHNCCFEIPCIYFTEDLRGKRK